MGTFPAGEQSASTAAQVWSSTLRDMGRAAGSAHTFLTATSTSDAPHLNHIGMWISPPLDGSGTAGGGNCTVNYAAFEASTQANVRVNGACIYVWRPSTGAVVGYIKDTTTGLTGALEPNAASSIQAAQYTFDTDPVSYSADDVIVFEMWMDWDIDGTTMRSGRVYYDGTTEQPTQNTVVTNHASFFELAETLVFDGEGGGETVTLDKWFSLSQRPAPRNSVVAY